MDKMFEGIRLQVELSWTTTTISQSIPLLTVRKPFV